MWQMRKLGEICSFLNGFAFKSTDAVGSSNLQLLRMGNLYNNELQLDRKPVFYPDRFSQEHSKYLLKQGDLIISLTGTVGKRDYGFVVEIPDNKTQLLLNQRIAKFIEIDATLVIKEFLLKVLRSESFLNDLYASANGTRQANLSTTSIRNIEIPLPPLQEQKRIVAILDQAFAEIDKARANAARNLKNARELFDKEKASIFANVAQKSPLKPIAETCKEIFAGGDAPKHSFSKLKTDKYAIPILANAVKDNGLYGYTEFARVTEPSVTLAARGSGTGHTEIRREAFLPIVRLIVLTPNEKNVDVDYLYYAIQNLDILRSGSAIPQLTIPMIKSYSVPIPNLATQVNVVRNIEKLKVLIEKLLSSYEQRIELFDELKKSILQKAFTGELTKSKGTAA